jgi:hypothetical protein
LVTAAQNAMDPIREREGADPRTSGAQRGALISTGVVLGLQVSEQVP